MRLITAVIEPHKVDEVKEAVQGIGVRAMTVSDVRGFGRQAGHTETYRGAEHTVDLIPKVELEIVAERRRCQDREGGRGEDRDQRGRPGRAHPDG